MRAQPSSECRAPRVKQMQITPILHALRKNKTGAILIALQIALTMAIMSNLVLVIQERISATHRSTGVDESNVFTFGYRLDDGTVRPADIQADLAGIRSIPGVVDVFPSNRVPLQGGGWNEGVNLEPGFVHASQDKALAAVYGADEHALATLGLRLVEGRNFEPTEVLDGAFATAPFPHAAIITQALATQLFGSVPALGRSIFLSTDNQNAITVVGVIDKLQTPGAADSVDGTLSEWSVILPMHNQGAGGMYVVRTQPGHLDRVISAIKPALVKLNAQRVLKEARTLAEVRAAAYNRASSMAMLLSAIGIVLLVVTGFGVVGLTSNWVSIRRRQIGVRRALGATRAAILRYFLVENLIITVAGMVAGTALGLVLNAFLVTHYGASWLGLADVIGGSVIILVLTQLSAIAPSVRASRLPPVVALRS